MFSIRKTTLVLHLLKIPTCLKIGNKTKHLMKKINRKKRSKWKYFTSKVHLFLLFLIILQSDMFSYSLFMAEICCSPVSLLFPPIVCPLFGVCLLCPLLGAFVCVLTLTSICYHLFAFKIFSKILCVYLGVWIYIHAWHACRSQ